MIQDDTLGEVDGCAHENKEIYAPGISKNIEGYCIDCGLVFAKGINSSVETSDAGASIVECNHPFIQEDINGTSFCTKCFIEMDEPISFEPEWKCYQNLSGGKDRTRCHRHKSSYSRGIQKFFESHGISLDKSTIARIEAKHDKISSTMKTTSKNQGRSGLLAAIWYFDLWEYGNARTSDNVRELCGVCSKDMTTGLQRFQEVFPEKARMYLKPVDLLGWLINLYQIDRSHYDKIKTMIEKITANVSSLNDKSPQSVASSIIYLYLCLNKNYRTNLGMTKTKFAEKSQLSESTIHSIIDTIKKQTKCSVKIAI